MLLTCSLLLVVLRVLAVVLGVVLLVRGEVHLGPFVALLQRLAP